MTKKVLIFGGGGGGASIAMAMKEAGDHNCLYGFINDKDEVKDIVGFPVVGGKDDIPGFINEGFLFINAVQKIDGQKYRMDLFESFHIPEKQLFTYIHPKAYVAPNAEVGPGCVIMPTAIVDSGSKIGKNVRVFPGAAIRHHCVIDDYVFLGGCSVIGSYTKVGTAVYCGYNSTIGQRLLIEKYSVVGMGSVVCKNVQSFSVVVGNPANHLRYVKDKVDE